jgi:hypothetical protein
VPVESPMPSRCLRWNGDRIAGFDESVEVTSEAAGRVKEILFEEGT